jgi:hypothetical protein
VIHARGTRVVDTTGESFQGWPGRRVCGEERAADDRRGEVGGEESPIVAQLDQPERDHARVDGEIDDGIDLSGAQRVEGRAVGVGERDQLPERDAVRLAQAA